MYGGGMGCVTCGLIVRMRVRTWASMHLDDGLNKPARLTTAVVAIGYSGRQ
jgi:hypothetical protein